MKYAADFRELARNALRGKWCIAVIVGLVAVLLGGAGNEGPEINLNIEGGNANLGFEIAGQTIFSTGGGLNSDIGAFLAGSAIYIMLAALVIAAIHLFLGSVVGVGYKGSKEMLLVEDIENRDFLKELFDAMYEELPN